MTWLKRQFAAGVLWITIPIWIVPWIMYRAFQWVYEDICGWDDF